MLMLLLLLPRPVTWRLRFTDSETVAMNDVASLFYDLTLLHDAIVLSLLEEYDDYMFSQRFWYRQGRPVRKEHQLCLHRLSYQSPLEIVTIISAAGASIGTLWALLQATQKIQNWRLDRKKLELEVAKLLRDANMADLALAKEQLDVQKLTAEVERRLAERNTAAIVERIVSRIERNQLLAIEAEFRFLDKHDTK